MRTNLTIAVRYFLALTGLLVFAWFGAPQARGQDEPRQAEPRQPVAIQFSLDRPVDAGAAPLVLAATNGLFGAEGLAVTTNIASGSADAIARVAAGSSDFALIDI